MSKNIACQQAKYEDPACFCHHKTDSKTNFVVELPQLCDKYYDIDLKQKYAPWKANKSTNGIEMQQLQIQEAHWYLELQTSY